LTAHRALTANGPVQGKTVLVTGGAGAVGLQAIQLAKWMGARFVIATVSGPEKAEAALEAGADDVINYRHQDVVEAVEAATDGEGVDHIVEVEFGGNLAASVALIRPHGLIASYGSEGEKTPELPFYDLMFKNAGFQSVFVYTLTPAQRAGAVADVRLGTRHRDGGACPGLLERQAVLRRLHAFGAEPNSNVAFVDAACPACCPSSTSSAWRRRCAPGWA
jgi:NADPH2:quinone reductase